MASTSSTNVRKNPPTSSSNDVRKDPPASNTNDSTYIWSDEETRLYLQLRLEERDKGNAKKAGINDTGKKNIMDKFSEVYGSKHRWGKFRNKYNTCKKQYSTFKRLTHTSGLGYFSNGAIDMTDDWWEDRIKLKMMSLPPLMSLPPQNMSSELCSVRPLFGGAISTVFPQRFQDVSSIRQVPDHQEVFVDPSRDESLIFELLDFKTDVGDIGSASWFLNDLAREQDAEGFQLIEQSEVLEAPGLSFRNIPAVVTTAIGEMAISKGRQGREAQNLVRVYVANLRLKGVDTDVLVTAYEPILINPLSESADAVGSGLAVPASQSGIMPMCDVIKQSLSTFKVNDWSLFGSSA